MTKLTTLFEQVYSTDQDADLTETPAFKNWFGNSQVVDNDGKPAVVYHGTMSADIKEFNRKHSVEHFQRRASWDQIGIWLSSIEGSVERGGAARYGKNVLPLYASIEYPFEFPTSKDFLDAWNDFHNSTREMKLAGMDPARIAAAQELRRYSEGFGDPDGFRESLIHVGADGILIRNWDGDFFDGDDQQDLWVAFEPEQLKSVKNKGTFNRSSKNIYEAVLQESKLEYVKNTFGADLQASISVDTSVRRVHAWEHDAYNATDEDLLNFVLQTFERSAGPNGKHLVWIVRQYNRQFFRFEDVPRVNSVIQRFEAAKHLLDNKDLNTYKHISDVEDALEAAEGKKSARQTKLDLKRAGSRMIEQNEHGVVLEITSEDAAKYYGKGTRWCTAAENDNAFKNYYYDGLSPLYVFILKSGDKYQLWLAPPMSMDAGSVQFMDARDISLPLSKQRLLVSHFPKMVEVIDRVINNYQNAAVDFDEGSEPLLLGRIIAVTGQRNAQYERDIVEALSELGNSRIEEEQEYETGVNVCIAAIDYCINVISGRWPELENVLNEVTKVHEEILYEMTPEVIRYAVDVIGGCWEVADRCQPFVERETWEHYKRVCKNA